jgi:hypothetical protein
MGRLPQKAETHPRQINNENYRRAATAVEPTTKSSLFEVPLTKKAATANEGEHVTARAAEGFAKNFPFSGTVYVYLDNSLSDKETAELKKLYMEHGADIQVRDFGYAIEFWNKIKTGKAELPPEYRLTSEFPQPVTDEKHQ